MKLRSIRRWITGAIVSAVAFFAPHSARGAATPINNAAITGTSSISGTLSDSATTTLTGALYITTGTLSLTGGTLSLSTGTVTGSAGIIPGSLVSGVPSGNLWTLSVSGQGSTTIATGNTVTLSAGTNTTLTLSGNTVTVNSIGDGAGTVTGMTLTLGGALTGALTNTASIPHLTLTLSSFPAASLSGTLATLSVSGQPLVTVTPGATVTFVGGGGTTLTTSTLGIVTISSSSSGGGGSVTQVTGTTGRTLVTLTNTTPIVSLPTTLSLSDTDIYTRNLTSSASWLISGSLAGALAGSVTGGNDYTFTSGASVSDPFGNPGSAIGGGIQAYGPNYLMQGAIASTMQANPLQIAASNVAFSNTFQSAIVAVGDSVGYFAPRYLATALAQAYGQVGTNLGPNMGGYPNFTGTESLSGTGAVTDSFSPPFTYSPDGHWVTLSASDTVTYPNPTLIPSGIYTNQIRFKVIQGPTFGGTFTLQTSSNGTSFSNVSGVTVSYSTDGTNWTSTTAAQVGISASASSLGVLLINVPVTSATNSYGRVLAATGTASVISLVPDFNFTGPRGFAIYQLWNAGISLTSMETTTTSITKPIFNAWNPSAVTLNFVDGAGDFSTGLESLSASFGNWGYIGFAIPPIGNGTTQTLGSGAAEVQNAHMASWAKATGNQFFDGNGIAKSYANMISIQPGDDIHPPGSYQQVAAGQLISQTGVFTQQDSFSPYPVFTTTLAASGGLYLAPDILTNGQLNTKPVSATFGAALIYAGTNVRLAFTNSISFYDNIGTSIPLTLAANTVTFGSGTTIYGLVNGNTILLGSPLQSPSSIFLTGNGVGGVLINAPLVDQQIIVIDQPSMTISISKGATDTGFSIAHLINGGGSVQNIFSSGYNSAATPHDGYYSFFTTSSSGATNELLQLRWQTATVNGTLAPTSLLSGPATMSSTLNVTGTTSLGGELDVTGNNQMKMDLNGTNFFFGNFGASGGTTYGFSKPGTILFSQDLNGNTVIKGTLTASTTTVTNLANSGAVSGIVIANSAGLQSTTTSVPAASVSGAVTGFIVTPSNGVLAGVTLSTSVPTLTISLPFTLTGSGTFSLSATTSVSGGGLISLGGFTLTVPATGTAGLLGVAQTFSGANTFSNTISLTGAVNMTGILTPAASTGYFLQINTTSGVITSSTNSAGGGGVSQVTGTVGQIAVATTTSTPVVSLPSTLTLSGITMNLDSASFAGTLLSGATFTIASTVTHSGANTFSNAMVTQTISALALPTLTSTNSAGNTLSLASGLGTGTGTHGLIAFLTPVSAASGSASQTQTIGWTMDTGTFSAASTTTSILIAGLPTNTTTNTAPIPLTISPGTGTGNATGLNFVLNGINPAGTGSTAQTLQAVITVSNSATKALLVFGGDSTTISGTTTSISATNLSRTGTATTISSTATTISGTTTSLTATNIQVTGTATFSGSVALTGSSLTLSVVQLNQTGSSTFSGTTTTSTISVGASGTQFAQIIAYSVSPSSGVATVTNSAFTATSVPTWAITATAGTVLGSPGFTMRSGSFSFTVGAADTSTYSGVIFVK